MTKKTGSAQSAPPSLVWLDNLKNAVVDLLFPPHCVACRNMGAWLCAGCMAGIEGIHPPVCPRCGMPLSSPSVAGSDPSFCRGCEQAPHLLDGLRACAFHGGPLREAIHQLKYQDLRSLAHPLGKLLAERWLELAPPGLELDVIVPVPLHPTRQRQRGYNQAALLARELAAHLHRPVIEDNLVRTRATAPQVDLDAEQRRTNVRGAFRCTGNGLSGKCVMLVDDVYTTGSTLESACTALRKAGTSSVWAYTLARAKAGPYEPSEQSTIRRMENGTHSKG